MLLCKNIVKVIKLPFASTNRTVNSFNLMLQMSTALGESGQCLSGVPFNSTNIKKVNDI